MIMTCQFHTLARNNGYHLSVWLQTRAGEYGLLTVKLQGGFQSLLISYNSSLPFPPPPHHKRKTSLFLSSPELSLAWAISRYQEPKICSLSHGLVGTQRSWLAQLSRWFTWLQRQEISFTKLPSKYCLQLEI